MPEHRLNRRDFIAVATMSAALARQAAGRTARHFPVRIGPGTLYRQFDGWGTSLAWWAHVVGGFPAHVRDIYMRRIFDPVHGLGLTVARYNIGGGENPRYHFLTHRAAIPGFAPHPPRFDWAADKNQRLILHDCIRMGVNQVQAFSNSPPWYMTISGSVTGGRRGQNNLRPQDFGSFADYLAIVVAHFDWTWGIRFQTVEAFNEPVSYWWKFGGSQEGCRIGNREQNLIIPLLYRALKSRNLVTEIAAPDDNAVNQTIESFKSYGPAARREVTQIDTHSYHGHGRVELRQLAQGAGKRLWMSEYGDGDATGITMAQRIIKDIRELQPRAWVYWQVVDGPGWGMMVNPENGRSTGFHVTAKYYVMAQFSRFIRPGDWILDVDSGNCIASYRPDSHTLNVVAVNPGETAMHPSLDLSAFDVARKPVRTYLTDGRDRCGLGVERQWHHHHLQCVLPPRSVKTWVFTNCRMSD